MSVEKHGRGWRARWRDDAGVVRRSRTFTTKRDAALYDAEVKRRKALGSLAAMDAGRETLNRFMADTWAPIYGPALAPATREGYSIAWDLYVSPRLGSLALRDISAEALMRWIADMRSAGVGEHAQQRAMTVLSSVLGRAAEAGRIPINPCRNVRKPRITKRVEVRPLAPSQVEAMRAVCGDRDATLISVLAYAGLRPQEALALRWDDVRENTLWVYSPKTRSSRSVKLLAPLAGDLRGWRMASGRPDCAALVFPGAGGEKWTREAYKGWTRSGPRGQRRKDGKRAGAGGAFGRAATATGVEWATPYTLRHSFASLLLHEGRSVIYTARQMGHGAQLTLSTYGHVIDEFEDAAKVSAEQTISDARRPAVAPVWPKANESGGASA